MKCFRSLILIIALALVTSTAVDAMQLGGLLKRAKKRAEDKIEQLAEREVEKQVDRTVDKLVEGIWEGSKDQIGKAIESALPKSKTSVDLEKGTISQEGKPDQNILPNADSPLNVEFASYMLVSIVKLPEQLAAIADRLGNATVEEVRYHNNRKLTGGAENGILIEHDLVRFTYLDHVSANFWSMTYEEMFAMAGEAMDTLRAHLNQISPPPEAATEEGPQINAEVTFTLGDKKRVRGLEAQQGIVVVETTMESMEGETDGESAGKLWVVMEVWSAEEYAGSETLDAFDRIVGEGIIAGMGGETLNSSLDFSAFGDPRLMEGMTEASARLDDMKGLPVETNAYFVMTGENDQLDVDAILNGGPSSDDSSSQVVMLSTKSFVSNLNSDPFDPAEVIVPETYSEIESPLFQFQGVSTEGDN